MPKPADKPAPDAKPSEPIKKKDKTKDQEKIKKAKRFQLMEIEAEGTITAGTWVAEMDKANVRKNVLRV